MRILIVGNGNYVCGKGTSLYGTILPAIFEFQRNSKIITNVVVAGTNNKSSKIAKKKYAKIKKLSGVDLKVNFLPSKNLVDNETYLKAIKYEKNFDCAIIATPDHTHYKIANRCIDHGLHCLVVKPLTSTVKQAKDLIHKCKKNNIYGAVEFHKRWDRQNLILKDFFQSREIGTPLYTWTEYSQKKIVPKVFFKSWVNKNNVFQYLGVHYVDIIRFISQAIPVKVMATGQSQYLNKIGIKTQDSIQTIIEWKMPNGIKFNQIILTNWVDPNNSTSMSDQNIKIVGTKGRIESDQKNRGLTSVIENKNYENINPDFCKMYGTKEGNIVWKGYGIESVQTFLKDVISLKKNKQQLKEINQCRPTFQEALISTAVIESANKSLLDKSKWKKVKL